LSADRRSDAARAAGRTGSILGSCPHRRNPPHRDGSRSASTTTRPTSSRFRGADDQNTRTVASPGRPWAGQGRRAGDLDRREPRSRFDGVAAFRGFRARARARYERMFRHEHGSRGARVGRDARRSAPRPPRAGRTETGICYRPVGRGQDRLARAISTRSEILTADLSSLVLDLAQWASRSPISHLPRRAAPAALARASVLREVGAIDADGR